MNSQSRQEFERSLAFDLDDFQREALDALDTGASVVVAAPTGSGKTIVAEYAVHRAVAQNGKTFYTAPIKALSNQKFNDLVARYGAEQVGLLTGDNSINGDAPIVVMTTEVLRNMIYAQGKALDRLRYVVLDEVHYLQDAYRGPVWEEIIIHTPVNVAMVCLSATVSNAEELASWVASVRGPTSAVIHEKRPIELQHLYLVGNRDTNEVTILPTFVKGRPNPQAIKFDTATTENVSPRANRRHSTSTPKRVEIVSELRHGDMLPAIYFIFSRAACDEAVRACLQSGVRLTNPNERREISAIVESRVAGLNDADLDVLGYRHFLSALQGGYAAHHAGMVPPFKEAVEACFVEGLVKVVFATETLALGINMPARTVVVEKLSKFGGERHQFLTPGEFTQLTGRAGRRGIDNVGYAATLWTPFVDFEQVASLASLRTYELRSSFRPTNNMAVNLVRRYGPDDAHHLLGLSFAQFRIDAELAMANTRADRLRRELGDARTAAHCERGDIGDYLRLQKNVPRKFGAFERDVAALLDSLQPGDVLGLPVADPAVLQMHSSDEHFDFSVVGTAPRQRPGDGWLVVVATAKRRDRDTTVKAISPSGRSYSLTPRDFGTVPLIAGRVKLPSPFHPNSRSFQQQAANALSSLIDRSMGPKKGSRLRKQPIDSAPESAESDSVRSCPDFVSHVTAYERVQRIGREIEKMDSSSRDRRSSLTDQFDAVLTLLEDLGYLAGWSVTPMGDTLAGIFHEADLLIAECLRDGVLDGMKPADLCALVSCFVFEERGPGSKATTRNTRAAQGFSSRRASERTPSRDFGRNRSRREKVPRRGDLPPDFPRALAGRYWTMTALSEDLNDCEADLGLPLTKTLDPGFVGMAKNWASGAGLEAVLNDSPVTGGDFVRTIKSLIDLLRQIGKVAPHPDTARTARSAADALFRGVVSATSMDSSPPLLELVVPVVEMMPVVELP